MIEKPAGRAATWLGGFAITATALAWVLLLRTVISGFIDRGFHDSGLLWQTIAYVAVTSLLTFSAFMYLLARRGAQYRARVAAVVTTPTTPGPSALASYVDVDVTTTPSYPFETPSGPAQAHVVLSFVVADPARSCTPA